jgi:hypothetical protein
MKKPKLKTFDVDVYVNRTVTMRVRAPSEQQARTAVDNGAGKEVEVSRLRVNLVRVFIKPLYPTELSGNLLALLDTRIRDR